MNKNKILHSCYRTS